MTGEQKEAEAVTKTAIPCPQCGSVEPLFPHHSGDNALAPDWSYSCATRGCRERFDHLSDEHPDAVIARGYRVEWYGEDA